jgi:hypothetical protein
MISALSLTGMTRMGPTREVYHRVKKEERSCLGLVETVAQVGQASVERKTPAGEPGVPQFVRIKNSV